jgi:hypothetical protein
MPTQVIASRPPTATVWKDPSNDPDLERRIRQLALPAALLLAWVVTAFGPRFLGKVFLSMWVHEIGHAVAAWLCGFGAFPGPWRTPVSEGRMVIVTLLVLGGLGYAGFRAWSAGARPACVALAVLALVTLWCTLGLKAQHARAFITFGGDGGCLLLGALMMTTIYVPPGSALHRGWLRWGFLVIGAFAFMDAFTTWWDAGHSPEGVELGQIEGVGDSDPTRLMFEYGWGEARLISRYMTLAWACLAGLAVLYVWNLAKSRDQ